MIKTSVEAWGAKETVLDDKGVTYSADGKYLVYGNYDLREYTVRDGVEVICDEAFFDGLLQRITLPESLKVIGEDAFALCNRLQGITLPESLKVIGKDAFAHCDQLEEVVLPAGVEDIRDGAFWGCLSLKRVVLSMTTKRISETAFPKNSDIVMV